MNEKNTAPAQGGNRHASSATSADTFNIPQNVVNAQHGPRITPMDPATVSPEAVAESQRTGKRLVPVSNVPDPPGFFTDTDDVIPDIAPALIPSLEVSRSTGKVQATFANLRLIVDSDPVFRRITRFDRATGELKHSPKYAGMDALFADLAEYLAEIYGLEAPIPKLEWIATRQGHQPRNQFNSVVEAIAEIPAPTVNPLDDIVEGLQLENPDDAPHVREILDLWLKKASLQLAVPEATNGELVFPNDVIPVLHGPQGIGKTLLSSALAINPNLYLDVGTENLDDLGGRDGMMKLAGLDVAELGEYRSPKTLEVIKSLASITRFKYRQPYARSHVEIPRTVSYIATTNTRHFLTDGTGNRRFYPVNLHDVDRSMFEDRSPFAALRAYYFRWAIRFIDDASDDLRAALFTVRESDELARHLDVAREAVRHVDSTEEVIEGYFDTVAQCVATGDYSPLAETRPTQAHQREFYSALEAVTIIYPHGRHPNNFYRTFTEVATRAGMIQQKLNIAGRRIRAWIPDSAGTEGGTTEGTRYRYHPGGKKRNELKEGEIVEEIDSNSTVNGSGEAVQGFQTGGGTWYPVPSENAGGTRI